MTTTYPTTIQTLTGTRGTDGQPLNAPNHVTHHTTEDDTIVALETKVGVDGSAVAATHDYKLSEVLTATPDKAVGKVATQTLSNKTLTSPKITAGSMSKGDMFQLSAADGTLTPFRASANANIPSWNSVTEQWEAIANPAASDASTTVKGVVEIATTAQITAGTGAGETGALLVVPASAVGAAGASKLVQYTSGGLYPAADGSLITGLTQAVTAFKNGTTTKVTSDASATQTIAHGLGVVPKKVRLTATTTSSGAASAGFAMQAITVYNGTTQSSNSTFLDSIGRSTSGFSLTTGNAAGDKQEGVVTFDATNISIAWTKTLTGAANTFTYQILWEAEA